MSKEQLMKLNLQMFSEPGANDGAQSGADGGTDEGAGDETKTFDDVLTNREYQAEFDRRVNKAINTSKSKWESELPDLIQQEVEKQRSYAELSDEDKAQKKIDDEWAKIKQAQADIERSNLIASIKSDLAEKDLPIKVGDFDFSEVFASLGNDDKALQAVNAFKEAYDESIEAEVDKRLASSAFTPDGFNTPNTGTKAGERGKALAKKTTNKQQESNFFKN